MEDARTGAIRAKMELGRHARRWSDTRNAGRHGALRGGLGSKTHNAFRAALKPGRGRRRKAVNRVERNQSKLQIICPMPRSNSVPSTCPASRVHSRPWVSFAPAATWTPPAMTAAVAAWPSSLSQHEQPLARRRRPFFLGRYRLIVPAALIDQRFRRGFGISVQVKISFSGKGLVPLPS